MGLRYRGHSALRVREWPLLFAAAWLAAECLIVESDIVGAMSATGAEAASPSDWILVGVAHCEGTASFAIVENVKDRRQVLVHVGDVLGDRLVAEITAAEIALSTGEKPRLVPRGESGDPDFSPEGSTTRAKAVAGSRRDVQEIALRRKDILAALGEIGLISEAPSVGGRGPEKGYRVSEVATGSLLEDLGLEVGDTVLSISGRDLRSLSNAETLEELAGEPHIALRVIRGDVPMTLLYVVE